MELSVVIPVYNSSESLRQLTARLLAALEDLHVTHEIVFVDDGSRDRSWEVLQEIQAEHSDRVLCVQLMRNFGQHNALMCGFRHTQGRFVVTMDDDLQNPPEEIGKLLDAIRSQSLGRIEAGDYGFCDETGEPIGLGRLIARPTATLSLEAQQRRELKQKMFGD